MKRLFLTMAVALISSYVFSQTTQEQWTQLMQSSKTNIDNILYADKPSDMDMTTYKLKLIEGGMQLSERARMSLESNVKPLLVNYGMEVSSAKGLAYEDESDLIFNCVISPNCTVSNDIYTARLGSNNRVSEGGGLTWSEVLYCAGQAVGITAIASLTQSGASSWSWSAIKKAFKAAAKRVLGPIGVVIAGISFGYCLIGEAND
jgi:hypothetical protein